MKNKPKYRTFGGEEFFSDGFVFESREQAKKIAEWTRKQVKQFYPNFKFKYRIVKTKDGYKLYTNNTVRNMKNI